MSPEDREKERTRKHQYYQENREKILRKALKYRQQHREELRQKQRAYYLRTRATRLQHQKTYNQKHKKENSLRQKIYQVENRLPLNQYRNNWRQQNAEKYKEYRLKHYEEKFKKILKNPTDRLSGRRMIVDFATYTSLLYDDELPRKCQRCGSTRHLHIHHKKYSMPVRKNDICTKCHFKIHYPYDNKKRRKLADRLRCATRRYAQSIGIANYCEACGTKKNLTIHHIRYRKPLRRQDLKRLCRHCHYEVHRYRPKLPPVVVGDFASSHHRSTWGT